MIPALVYIFSLISATCYVLYHVGYETTSNCLAYTSYLLALNPDKQDQLYEEIEQFYNENPVSI